MYASLILEVITERVVDGSLKLTFSLNLVQVLQFVRARVLVLWYSNNGETDMFLQYLFWYVNGFSKFAYVELLIATTCINFRLAMLSAVKSPSNQVEELSKL